jgi:hypothetical protein
MCLKVEKVKFKTRAVRPLVSALQEHKAELDEVANALQSGHISFPTRQPTSRDGNISCLAIENGGNIHATGSVLIKWKSQWHKDLKYRRPNIADMTCETSFQSESEPGK